jgi:hypothetical protein
MVQFTCIQIDKLQSNALVASIDDCTRDCTLTLVQRTCAFAVNTIIQVLAEELIRAPEVCRRYHTFCCTIMPSATVILHQLTHHVLPFMHTPCTHALCLTSAARR